MSGNNLFTFDPEFHLTEICVVGLGGTGSQLARSLARMLYHMRLQNLEVPKMTFIDPDRVELKNVGRQMFTAADVGQYKAEVLARRFNLALGLNIRAINAPFNSKEHAGWNALFCGAVDNHLARQQLARASEIRTTVWIDAGNHKSGGQVIVGNSGDWGEVENSFDRPKDKNAVRRLPHAGILMPSLLEPDIEPEPAADLSCAELLALNEQHLLINDMMGIVAAQYAYKLLLREPIESFITYIDLGGISVSSKPITRANVEYFMPAHVRS